jgi:flagellar assembly factor FliW
MPLGLLGFERIKRYALAGRPADEPFLWLQMLEEPKLAFLVVSPFLVLPTYDPGIPDDDRNFLDLQGPDDTIIFNIVKVHGPQQATVNLKGPIVLNRRLLVAKQIIPVNASDFSVAHPLPLQSS